MCPNDADRMANSVDPDESASTASVGTVWSGSVCSDLSDLLLTRHCYKITSSEYVCL